MKGMTKGFGCVINKFSGGLGLRGFTESRRLLYRVLGGLR